MRDIRRRTSYIWPLPSPALVFGPNTTILMEIKPESGGLLISSGDQFTLGTVESGEEQAVEYRAIGKHPVA